jgi:protein-S-isoprenylcysteine O-methyltransferase Ste14
MRMFAVAIPVIVGSVVSLFIVLALAGAFFPVQIPFEYKATYGRSS